MGRKLLERLGCGPREGFGSLTHGTREAVRCTRERALKRCVALTGRAGRARVSWAAREGKEEGVAQLGHRAGALGHGEGGWIGLQWFGCWVGLLTGRAGEGGKLGWCGLLGQEGRSGPPGWVGFGFFFSYFFPLFYFKHHSHLFEFKSNLNSNSYALKQVKLMHQHECTNKLALK